MLVKELTDGVEIDQVLLVKRVERRERRDGQPYLRLGLGDRTGTVRAMVWDDVQAYGELIAEGEPIHVRGRFSLHPDFGPEIKLLELVAPDQGQADLSELRETAPRAVDQMERDLRALLATIHDRHLRALLDGIFDIDCDLWSRYRVAPAAKYYHQAYEHGLLEHCLGVAQAVSATAVTFPGIDREVAVTGALLHDIGKLEAYADRALRVEMTDLGRLHGEIALGYYRVRRMIEAIDGFPEHRARAVLHIILAHHGTLENGSPVVPCTREATLVHMIDNLGGRLGSFDRLQRELAPGRSWSDYDRAIGAAAFFGAEEEPRTSEGAPPPPAAGAAAA
jgi:3'-5' exoribonuclease